jgi:hypothetical protein
MNLPDWVNATTLITAVLLVIGSALVLTIALVLWVLWNVRRINLPPDADLVTTLRATPLVVVVVLDLLDLSLDVFSAPITWALLTRLGLAPLRWVAVIKDLIPIADIIPAMTIAWAIARLTEPPHAYIRQPIVQRRMIEPPRGRTRNQ